MLGQDRRGTRPSRAPANHRHVELLSTRGGLRTEGGRAYVRSRPATARPEWSPVYEIQRRHTSGAALHNRYAQPEFLEYLFLELQQHWMRHGPGMRHRDLEHPLDSGWSRTHHDDAVGHV